MAGALDTLADSTPAHELGTGRSQASALPSKPSSTYQCTKARFKYSKSDDDDDDDDTDDDDDDEDDDTDDG